jgi:invasion protein IalB
MARFPLRFFTALFAAAFLLGGFALPAAAAGKAQEPNSYWTVRCEKGAKSQKDGKCEIFQRLILKENGKRVTEMAIGFPEKKDTARGVIVLPLGVLLTEGMTLQIDANPAFAFKVRYCSNDGCFAYVNLSKAVLDTMRKGSKATLSFRTMQGKKVNVVISLKDFDKSLKQVAG